MTRGRKPKPTALKLVGGNAGKRALNKREPKPTGNLTEPPEWLTEQQSEGWRYAIANAPYGLLKLIDRSALVAWVVAEDLHRQAAEKLNGGAMLIKTPNGMPVQSPYLSIINKQAAIMIKAASEMGFSPASRSRVEIGVGEQEDDPADRYFG
jgi:P27 family predicted phage terminase small subunit